MKNFRPLLLSRPLVISGLIVALLLATATALLSVVSTRDVARAGLRLNRTQATVLEINQLLNAVIDAETGQRGYILTGLDAYLAPYTQANAQIDDRLATLRHRFADSPAQLATLAEISRQTEAKKTDMRRSIELRRQSTIGPVLNLVDSGRGLKAMTAIREGVHVLEQHELTDLSVQSAAVETRAHFFQRASLAMIVIAVWLSGAGAYLLMRRVKELETMITVCAWTKRVKFNGQWLSFEDYLHERFNFQFTHGISEEAAQKLKMEEVELLAADRIKFGNRRISPLPQSGASPDQTGESTGNLA